MKAVRLRAVRLHEKIIRGRTKLRAFELADEVVVLIYRTTKRFPKEEVYVLTAQMRRAAVSVPSNIVEGYAREGQNPKSGVQTFFSRLSFVLVGKARGQVMH